MALAESLPWLVDLYLFVGALLVVVLIPAAHKAIREYWSTENRPFWIGAALFVVGMTALIRCSG
jgi:hypothetical protein